MIIVNNWSSYQSYKDRRPPWIRFHKTMLDNFEYHAMGDFSRALLPMLWLLASEDEDPVSGRVQCSYEKISFRLRTTKNKIEAAIKEIESAGFIKVIQPCNESVTKPYTSSKQGVTPETETETETETEKKAPLPDWLDLELWEEYRQHRKEMKSPLTPLAEKKAINQLEVIIGGGEEQREIINRTIANGWKGFFPDKRHSINKAALKPKNRIVL